MVYGRYAMVRGKCKMKNLKDRLSKKILLILASGLIVCGPKVQALPSQGTLDNSASATITTDMANNTMNIAGKGQNNIIDWASFNIDKGERVNFADKNNYLNLVHGVDMSRIYGTISGGNAVYLVNPNGILFADGAALDNVGGFVASTRNISSINKEAFLNDPTNTTAVLGVDNPVMDNKDYYPEDSKYVPKITMADLKLTNVPESATIILDGPGGVILKSKDLLNDKITHVITRQIGGELGFGYEGGIADLSLTDAEKEKVSLVNGDKYYGKDSAIPYPVRGYKWIRDWNELKDYSDINGRIMLVNDININNEFNPIDRFSGVFNGLGYSINGIKFKTKFSGIENFSKMGLFKEIYKGTLENINFKNIDIYYDGYGYSTLIGGIAAEADQCNISNVNTEGKITIVNDDSTRLTTGGMIGSASNTTIINSMNSVDMYIDRLCRCGWVGSYAYWKDENLDKIGGFVGEGDIRIIHSTNSGNIERSQRRHNATTSYMGGFAGTIGSYSKIIGCENLGDIKFSTSNGENKFTEIYSVGGFVGSSNSDVIIDSYNLGNIVWKSQSEASFNMDDGQILVGGIIGNDSKTESNNKIKNQYIKNNIPNDSRINTSNFGIGKRADELLLDNNLHDMIGVHDFSVQHTWPPIPPSSGDTGGGPTNPPSGGNTGGGTTNPPSGGGTTNPPSGGGTSNPPSGEPTNHPSEDDEFKYTFGMFIDDMKKGTEYWKNKYKEWKAEKEARKAEEKLQNELNKAIEEIDKMANDKKVDKAEISDNVKKGIDNSVIDKEIDKEEVKEKIAELFADAVALSIEKSGTTGFKPKDLWKRIHSSSDDVYVIVDGKKYIIKGSFTGESGALMGDFNVTVDKKNYNVTTFYTATNSAETFMNAASAYGKEVCYNVLTKISKDVTIMTKALAEPKVALTLWKECGGKDLVDNTVANQIKAQNNIKGILATVIPEAGDLIATIIDSPN